MLLSELRQAIRRRWYVVLVGVLVTGGLSVAAARVVPVDHETRALVLLLPPRALLESGGNPYLSLGGLDPATAVLGRLMGGEEVARQVAAVSPTAAYTVAPDLSTSGPVLVVIAEDTSGRASMAVLTKLLEVVPQQLASMQESAGAPATALITSSVVTQDDRATPLRKPQIRAVLMAGVLGLAATLGLTALAERWSIHRAQRKADRETEDDARKGLPTGGRLRARTGSSDTPPQHSRERAGVAAAVASEASTRPAPPAEPEGVATFDRSNHGARSKNGHTLAMIPTARSLERPDRLAGG